MLATFRDYVHKQRIDYFLQNINVNTNLNHVPMGMHLFFACDLFKNEECGPDGYRKSTFTGRRLLAGAEWIQHTEIPYDSHIENRIDIITNSDKKSEDWNYKYFVGHNLVFEDKRRLVYVDKVPLTKKEAQSSSSNSIKFFISEQLVNTYSILTMNTHKIHFDRSYAILEGYEDRIVQGSLTATLALLLTGNQDAKQVSFQAIRPIFVNREIEVSGSNKHINVYSEGLLSMRIKVDIPK